MNHFSPTNSLHELHGIIAPIVTPLLAQDTLDHQGLVQLTEYVLGGGVHAIHVLGGCGEGPSLSNRLNREVIGRVCQIVRGRVPVLVGIADCAFAETVALAEHAHECKAAGLVISIPYFYSASQAELASYIRHLHHEIKLPFALCSGYSQASTQLSAQVINDLLDLPLFFGLVSSAVPQRSYQAAMVGKQESKVPKFMTRPEELFDGISIDAVCGVMADCANLFPKLFVDWFEARKERDDQNSSFYQMVIEQLSEIFRIGGESASVIKSLKAGLAHLNVCGDLAAEPFQPLEESENAAIAAILEGVEHQLEHQCRSLSFV